MKLLCLWETLFYSSPFCVNTNFRNLLLKIQNSFGGSCEPQSQVQLKTKTDCSFNYKLFVK